MVLKKALFYSLGADETAMKAPEKKNLPESFINYPVSFFVILSIICHV